MDDKKMKLMEKGLLVQRRERLAELETEIEQRSRDITLNVGMYDGVRGIEMDAAEINLKQLKKLVKEFKELREKVKDYE